MKKIISLLFLILVSACHNLKPIDYTGYVDLKTPFNLSSNPKSRNYVFIPAYRTDIKNEEDYKLAKLECNSIIMNNGFKDSYCKDELRWRRNFGDLQFLDGKKVQRH